MNNARRNELWLSTCVIFAGACILLVPVALNGFPFLFQDSADYLIFTPRIYRSPFYGIFLFGFHWNHYIWMPVIAQALIVSHLLYLLATIFIAHRTNICFLTIIALLTALSSLPVFVGFVMPDIFTSIMFLAIYLMAFHYARFSLLLKIYIFCLTCVAIAVHLSHLMMAIILMAILPFFLRFEGISYKTITARLAVIFTPILLTIFAYILFNTLIFHTVTLFPAGQSFFLANLIQYGPARVYLNEACPNAGYKICPYVGRLQPKADDFLWQEGIFDKLGGFNGMQNESDIIVRQTLYRHPKQVGQMASQNFLNGLNTHAPAAELVSTAFPVWSSIKDVIRNKFGPGALNDFQNSAEMANTLPRKLIALTDQVEIPIAAFLLVTFTILAQLKKRSDLVIFSGYIIFTVFWNTLFCTMISGVHDRYQARVTWLLILAVLLIGLLLKNSKKIAENHSAALTIKSHIAAA